MTFATIAAISLLVGVVAAGFVWFGWGVVENLLASFMHKPEPIVEVPAEDEE